MGLIVPKAIFLRWSVRDLRYSQRFLSQKSSSSHKLFLLTKKNQKSQNLWELIDQFTNAIQYNTINMNSQVDKKLEKSCNIMPKSILAMFFWSYAS